MPVLVKGRYAARIGNDAVDMRAAQRLRHLSFYDARPGTRVRADGLDADALDPLCLHLLVEEIGTGTPLCCCRLLPLASGAEVGRSYSARHYDLRALSAWPGRLAEMGRFCIHPAYRRDADILRVAWAAVTRFVLAERVEMLFGCTSFDGVEPDRYRDAFALLHARHLAPHQWRPGSAAPQVVHLAGAHQPPDPLRARAAMPPLLRSYLALGGLVSDHAVIDRDLGTLHVFTGLEIAAIPPARARLLRAAAA